MATNWQNFYSPEDGAYVIPPEQYQQYFQGGTGGIQPQYTQDGGTAPVNTLASQVSGLNLTGTSGGGAATPIGGQTQVIKNSDGTSLLVDMTSGQVLSSYGTPGQDFAQQRQLQQERFAHEESMQAEREANANARQQNDPQNDPWRQMMPRYTPPQAVQGLRGGLDIIDPNTGELINVRQPEPPDVRIQGGNLIVPPGANAQVYYNGNKGQPTNVSGGPLPRNTGAQFGSAMDQANRVASRLQQRGQQGMGGMGGAGGIGGARGMGGGGAGGSRFGNPAGGFASRGGLGSNFAQSSTQSPVSPWDRPKPPWESPGWQDPYDFPMVPESELGPRRDIPESELGPYPWIPESELGPRFDIPESELGPYRNWDIPESELGGYY